MRLWEGRIETENDDENLAVLVILYPNLFDPDYMRPEVRRYYDEIVKNEFYYNWLLKRRDLNV